MTLDFVFDFGAFWVPFWTHFGTPNRPSRESILGHFLDVAPRAPQERPKRRQEAPKGAPRGPKRRPGRPQERPKRPQERPKRSPRGFKRPQEEPKGKRKRKEIGPKRLSEHHLFKNVFFTKPVQKQLNLMMFKEREAREQERHKRQERNERRRAEQENKSETGEQERNKRTRSQQEKESETREQERNKANLNGAFRFSAAQVWGGPSFLKNRSKIVSKFDHFFDRFLVPFWAPLGLHFGPLGRPSWPQVRSKRALGPSSFQKT